MTHDADALQAPAKPMPYFGAVPQRAELVFYAVEGFEIPSLPALSSEGAAMRGDVVDAILYRFKSYLAELHTTAGRRSIALQFKAHPDQSTLSARVRCTILCRSADPDPAAARADAALFVRQAMDVFPREGMFSYGSPRPLGEVELDGALFRDGGAPIELAEIRRHEEHLPIWRQPSLAYVPHRFWADVKRDPWLSLIETLASCGRATAVRVELAPVSLADTSGMEFVSLAGRWFGLIGEDLARRATQGEQVRTDGVVTEEMARQDELQRASQSASTLSYVKRGHHVFDKLITHCDHLFCMRVLVVSRGALSDAVVGSVRAALSTPPADEPDGSVGWIRPDVVRPGPGEAAHALIGVQHMALNRWQRSPRSEQHRYGIDLRSVVTPEEAVSLFHLPIYERAGQTSALSTADSPFVIPPETLSRTRFKADEKKVMIGYMYQREKLLSASGGATPHPFFITADDLMKPSLLVGAPGSGKTNIAFSLLLQLWKDCRIPFLVLDPSTGQEFRMLMADAALKEDLVVYTVGDLEGLPLQFNPFSVPPGVTVRNHTTRILSAFRAAFPMPNPVPAIYEAALERIYTDPRYTGIYTDRRDSEGRPIVMSMEEKGALDSPAPTLSVFAQAIQDELSEKAITLYQGSAESIGIIRGASTIRVNAIGKKVGHIINCAGNNGAFMQRLLERPVVIEMGGLGDSSNIALVMAFFLSQLAGHIEYAYRQMAERKAVQPSGDAAQVPGEDGKRRHVMFIEEAHRLLAKGDDDGVGGKSAEDLNMMLAEVRKFGQGIVVMDQRPSSLVGGVLDNAYTKILTRLSDREGFARLSDELNLSEAQQRYARTRLKSGEAILLDRDAGQSVLVRSDNAKGRLEDQNLSEAHLLAQNRANAERWKLEPSPHIPYEEPALPGKDAGADPKAKTRDWLNGRVTQAVRTTLDGLRGNSVIFHAAKDALGTSGPEAAKAAVDAALDREAPQLDRLTDELWERLKWAVVGLVAESEASKDVQDRLGTLRDAVVAARSRPEPVAQEPAQPVPPAERPGGNDRLGKEADRLASALAALVKDSHRAPNLWWTVRTELARKAARRDVALQVTRREMEGKRQDFDRLTAETWEQVLLATVEAVEATRLSEAMKAKVAERAAQAEATSP